MKVALFCCIGIFLCMCFVAVLAGYNAQSVAYWQNKYQQVHRKNKTLEMKQWADSIRHQLKHK